MPQAAKEPSNDPLYRFTIYIAGDTELSRRAQLNLRQILETSIPRLYALDVIDVFINPLVAIHNRVTITPMAVKTFPEPLRKVIGDFTDRNKVLVGLGIDAA